MFFALDLQYDIAGCLLAQLRAGTTKTVHLGSFGIGARDKAYGKNVVQPEQMVYVVESECRLKSNSKSALDSSEVNIGCWCNAEALTTAWLSCIHVPN